MALFRVFLLEPCCSSILLHWALSSGLGGGRCQRNRVPSHWNLGVWRKWLSPQFVSSQVPSRGKETLKNILFSTFVFREMLVLDIKEITILLILTFKIKDITTNMRINRKKKWLNGLLLTVKFSLLNVYFWLFFHLGICFPGTFLKISDL